MIPTPKTPRKTPRKPTTPMIAVGDKIIERPNPKKVSAMFQEAIEGLLSVDEMEAMYRGMMNAERIYHDRNGREIRCPDNHIRLATLKDYMDRVVGRPIERQQVMTFQQPATLETLLERIAESPVLRRTLLEMLQQAEA